MADFPKQFCAGRACRTGAAHSDDSTLQPCYPCKFIPAAPRCRTASASTCCSITSRRWRAGKSGRSTGRVAVPALLPAVWLTLAAVWLMPGRRHLSQKQALIKRMEKAWPPMCRALRERTFSVAVKMFSSCMALPHYSRTAQIRHFDSPDFGTQASETAVIICKLRSDMI